jgi:Ca2+-binding RTX toxin-like protein
MSIRTLYRLAGVLLAALVVSSIMSAMAASNSVPKSGLDEISRSITANDLKPAQCDAITLTHLIADTGVVNGTSQNDLILGGSGIDIISGGGGDDCIVGGGGNDTLIGGSGSDSCVGGAGVDVLDITCEEKYQ